MFGHLRNMASYSSTLSFRPPIVALYFIVGKWHCNEDNYYLIRTYVIMDGWMDKEQST